MCRDRAGQVQDDDESARASSDGANHVIQAGVLPASGDALFQYLRVSAPRPNRRCS